jgi:hypothetical protein
MKRTLIFILVIFTISLYAQPVENQSALTIEQVMQGEKFVGYSPSGMFLVTRQPNGSISPGILKWTP